MIRLLTYLAVSFVAALAIGCQDSTTVPQSPTTIKPLSSEPFTPETIVDAIDKIKVIRPNEATPYAGYIKRALKTADGGVVIASQRGIIQLNAEGEFIRKISDKGRAANEYISLADICVDYETNRLLILDNMNKVLFYDLDNGKFIKSVKPVFDMFNDRVDYIINGRNGGFVILAAIMSDKNRVEVRPTLYGFDSTGTMLGSSLEVDESMVTMNLVSQGYDNRYMLSAFDYNNTIHVVEDGVVLPLYYIDFEGKQAPKGTMYDSRGSISIGDYFMSPYYKFVSSIGESRDYLSFIVAGPEATSIQYLYNKKSGKIHSLSAPNGRTNPLSPLYADDQYLYYFYSHREGEWDPERSDPFRCYLVDEIGLLDDDEDFVIVGVKYKF